MDALRLKTYNLKGYQVFSFLKNNLSRVLNYTNLRSDFSRTMLCYKNVTGKLETSTNTLVIVFNHT